MKIINYISTLFFTIMVMIACDSKTDLNTVGDRDENNVVTKFLSDVKSLESDTNNNPIIAFKELAEKIAKDKMIVSKKNIKKVLIKSKEYSNCVIVTGNHTIVKIISFENCQESGSWKACMPTVEGYIKKGKLKYKKNYMNNVIGIPDKQERVAYFFNNDEIISKKKVDSYDQGQYSQYYENGEIKVNGCGYKKFYRYFVSAKDGLDLMKGAGLNSKKIANIPDNTELWIKSIEGKWLNIYTVFYLNPGDEGYDNEQIDPSQLGGYVNKKFIEIKPDSIKKPGFWTYYYQSGEIEREELHSTNFIKKIHYDDNGIINKIEEQDGDENDLFGWGPDRVSNTFHKNGKIKCVNEGSAGTAISYCFDENGKKLHSYNYEIGDYGFILSKDIRDLYFRNIQEILKEIKKLKISEDNTEEKIEINTTEIVDSDTSGWESPKNLFLIDDFYSSIIIRAEARYDRPDGINEEEINWIENTDTLQWWVLPTEGIAKKVNVTKNFIYTTKLCGDFGNFYATELDCDPNNISLACLGNPPKSWFKRAPKCIISKDEATQLINANLPIKFQNINNMVVITETIAGWDGYVNWCCPKEDNPLYENDDEMSIVEYRIPVNVSAKSKVAIGAVKAHIFGSEGSMYPSLKRDIDGDGILEVFWTGCQNYWTHNNKTFVSNIGDCCGC